MLNNSRADVVRLVVERYDTKSNVKLGGFRSHLEASNRSSNTAELWYNETICLWMTIYMDLYKRKRKNSLFWGHYQFISGLWWPTSDVIYIYIYIYIYIHIHVVHSVSKVEFAKRVGSRKQGLKLHLFQGKSRMMYPFQF